MKLDLGAEWEVYIDEKVRSGRYRSSSDVVLDGLRLLQEREERVSEQKDALRAELQQGLESLDRGEFVDLGDEDAAAYFADVNRRGRDRLNCKDVPAK